MKTISISLNDNLLEKMRSLVPAKKISKFVSSAISNELEKTESQLKLAYEQAENDESRQELISEWDAIDVGRVDGSGD